MSHAYAYTHARDLWNWKVESLQSLQSLALLTDMPVTWLYAEGPKTGTEQQQTTMIVTGSAAVLALAGRGVEPFWGRHPDVLPLGLCHRGEEREQQLAGLGGVVDPGKGSGEHLQDEAVSAEVIGERGEFGGVAAEGERGLELGAHPDAGADLLREHLVARVAVLGQRVEL